MNRKGGVKDVKSKKNEKSEIGDGINWNRLERGLPQGNSVANDRAPTLEEIRKIIKYPDIRVRVIVLIMASSGIRIGAWNHLKWKHVTAIKGNEKDDQNIIAAKLQIKRGKGKQHNAAFITYITPEAYNALKEYMDFRKSHGEEITPESWLIRDKFQTTTNKYAAGKSMIKIPKKLNSRGIQTLLSRALWSQGVRDLLPEGEQRHDFKLSHGFRKFFATNAHLVMRPANVEYLLDHKIGVSNSYLKPTEQNLLDDYVRAVDCLCIDNKDQKIATQLQKQVIDLEEKRNHDNYEILGRLAVKEKEVEEVKAEQKVIVQLLKKMLTHEWDANIDLRNPEVLNSESLEDTIKRINVSDTPLS